MLDIHSVSPIFEERVAFALFHHHAKIAHGAVGRTCLHICEVMIFWVVGIGGWVVNCLTSIYAALGGQLSYIHLRCLGWSTVLHPSTLLRVRVRVRVVHPSTLPVLSAS